MTGKLNGVIPATTPRGSSTVCTSTPVDTSLEYEPFNRWGRPQANSTFSRPRATSPAASLSTLPCSAVTAAARSGAAWATRSRKRKSTAALELSEPAPHSAAASFATSTAASTSAAEASGTSAVWTPRAGS